MDRIHQILNNISDTLLKSSIIPTPVVIVDKPLDDIKPVIKPELVNQELKIEQQKLANDRLQKDSETSANMEVEEEMEEMKEYKNDFYEMSVGSIRAIEAHAQKILASLNDANIAKNLTESWLQGKIAITEDYMRTIHDFVMFVSDDTDNDSVDAKQGLWDNIRKKREKEGKSYKPAKRGDEDRPDPEQWKKLTQKNK